MEELIAGFERLNESLEQLCCRLERFACYLTWLKTAGRVSEESPILEDELTPEDRELLSIARISL
jgi:hypothetical protein